MVLLSNVAVSIFAGDIAAAADVQSLVEQYLWGTPNESAAAAGRLTALPLDEVNPVLAAVIEPESLDYLNAIQLYTQFDDPATIRVLVDFLVEYAEDTWMRSKPYHDFIFELHETVISAVSSYGYDAAEPYLAQETTQHDYFWDAIARIYSKTGDHRAMRSLVDLARDGDEYTARSAASGLIRNEASWLVPELEIAYKAAPRRSSRYGILGVLRELWETNLAKEREFRLVTSDPIVDWYDVTCLSQEGFDRRLTDFQRKFVKNIEQIPEYGYARAVYQCNALSMTDYVSTGNDESVWSLEQQDWVMENREAIVDELMRPYRMWGVRVENAFAIYPSNAQVLAYLEADEALPWLRDSFVYSAGNHFTGEGAHPFSYFREGPFPYHDVLGGAIEYLTGKPLSDAIVLTPAELDFLIEDRISAQFSPTWLFRLYCLQPERAKEELFRLFRECGPEHDLNLAITIVDALRGLELSKQEIVRRLGPPSYTRGSHWRYSVAPYRETAKEKVAYTLRPTFSDDRLADIALLKETEEGADRDSN